MANGKKVLVDNVADESQVKNAERLEKLAEKQWKDDISWLMASPAGRRIAWAILEYCSVHESIFSPDSNILSYNSGRQDVGHWLVIQIGANDAEGLFTMMKEHKNVS